MQFFSNLKYIESLRKSYLENPDSVDPSWHLFFQGMDIGQATSGTFEGFNAQEHVESIDQKVSLLIQAYRRYGHLLAQVNPIDTSPRTQVKELELSHYGLKEEDLQKKVLSQHFFGGKYVLLKELIQALKETYCGKVGIEYMEGQNPDIEAFIQDRIEKNRFKVDLSFEDKKMILQRLNQSGLFENFLHTKYVGQKRFSLEGGETLIPVLAALIEKGLATGLDHLFIGMAHRGRLNVLSNILNKSHEEIFNEFEDNLLVDSVEGGGDVKYHKGYQSTFVSEQASLAGKAMQITLAANPSHLEAVNGVVLGQARGCQVTLGDDKEMRRVAPLLIHGDAAIAGQGIVYEAMQLGQLSGYETGGCLHVVINNQIGFTTLPKDARSTRYCTDIAKTFGAPVFHVNAEDPESCIFAAHLAMEIRQKFQVDVFIDLNCFRKYGHNEGDEPAFTQPLEYQLIRKKKSVRELYRDQLIHQGVMEKQMAEELEKEFKASLQASLTKTQKSSSQGSSSLKKPLDESHLLQKVRTQIPAKTLQALTQKLAEVPEGFHLHKKIQKLTHDREKMLQASLKENSIDWGLGEHLAFATLLHEGTHVRLSGQDARRGTFSHRHAMWMDQKDASKYFPLNHINPLSGRFDVFNSPLSEYGVLGFEYGYALSAPKALVIWEAQFGDFCNGAQIIIDQFISTAEHKWNSSLSLTLLLPHGYEGQGPEHSSARMERFLQLCGAANMLVCQPSTPAQLFHLLRRQVHAPYQKPLVVFTPKGLLRHRLCMSTLQDLTEGCFEEVIEDKRSTKKEQLVVLCSGRVFYSLIEEREKKRLKDVAIIRVEQLFPLHVDKLQQALDAYPHLKHVVWLQDEPKNMGPWDYIRIRLGKMLNKQLPMSCIGRERSASPAVGSFSQHQKEYEQLITSLINLQQEVSKL